MYKHTNLLLAVWVATFMLVNPIFANSPFDVNTSVKDSTLSVGTSDSSESIVSISSESDESTTKMSGVVTAEALNIRSAPWGDIIGTYKKGDKIEILGTLGDWYKVEYNGKTGYVHGNWVTTPNKKGQTKAKYGVVSNCYWLNVRRTPSGDILTQFKSGQQVYILGEVGDWYKIKYNGNEAFVSKKYIDLTDSASSGSTTTNNSSNSSFESFTGYVNATALNVRDGEWGTIVGSLYKGDAVKVIGKSGDWYLVEFNGKTRYVSANYIYNSKVSDDSPTSSQSTSNAISAGNGTLQQKIVSSARSLVGSTNFRTSDVSGGRLACAKVATTALKNAGALDRVYLNCRDSVKALKAKGWVEVTPPPYQEGDVITWKTYDYTGDGIKDEDTHIGIILKDGNTYKAMNNSSSLRTPRITNINIAPVSRVLRKVN